MAESMSSKPGSPNFGTVVSVRGSVVDIRFDEHSPPIYSLLHAMEGQIAIEVLSQLDAHRVRGRGRRERSAGDGDGIVGRE